MRWLLISILITACNSTYHLKRAKHHLKMAEVKGALVKVDTVTITKEVIVPSVQFDTVVREVNFTDTVVVTKDNVITKVKINTVERTVYVKTVCPPDTVKIQVPVTITKEIKSGYPWWWLLVASVLGLGMGAFLIRINSR